MRSTTTTCLLSSFAAFLLSAVTVQAEMSVKLEPFVTAVNTPLAMVQPKGDDRLFVLEQFGRVRIIQNGEMLAEPFLDIRNRLPTLFSDFDERGLLGITFHPNFKNNGRFFIAYSARLDFQGDLGKEFWWDHTNIVSEFKVSADDPNVADAGSERIISSMDWPQFNHNGHWIDFVSDGMLYISAGDGGYANDWGIGHNVTMGNGQDMTVLHGKILRVDVDGGHPYKVPDDNPFVGDRNAQPEIWAYGLRNPWRCSFDTGTGALICADVQQNSYEEIDIIEKGKNYGWRRMEATHCFDYQKPDDHPASCDQSGLTKPILEYNNCTAKPDGCKGVSNTGGYVYRGGHAAWLGKYFFGDWSKSFAEMDGQLFVATNNSGVWVMEHVDVTNMSGNLPYVLAFAQDAAGEVYVLTSIPTGPVGSLDTIYKIVPAQ